MSGRPQHPIGKVVVSDWGAGDTEAQYAVGDVVLVPEDCAAVHKDRCEPGLQRVEACFSIDEAPSFYYRLSPCRIVADARGRLRVVTDWGHVSDRVHVIHDGPDYTESFVLLYSARGRA